MQSPHSLTPSHPNGQAIGIALCATVAIAVGIGLHAAPGLACLRSNANINAESWGIRSPLSLVLTLPGVVLAGGLGWAGQLYGRDR